jgi:hypothetical protein
MKGGETMNKPLTIKELDKLCKEEIDKGRGDYTIMLSDDDEGNGYHYCWYSFTTPAELNSGFEDFELENMICGLSEDIAPIDKTIILG